MAKAQAEKWRARLTRERYGKCIVLRVEIMEVRFLIDLFSVLAFYVFARTVTTSRSVPDAGRMSAEELEDGIDNLFSRVYFCTVSSVHFRHENSHGEQTSSSWIRSSTPFLSSQPCGAFLVSIRDIVSGRF